LFLGLSLLYGYSDIVSGKLLFGVSCSEMLVMVMSFAGYFILFLHINETFRLDYKLVVSQPWKYTHGWVYL